MPTSIAAVTTASLLWWAALVGLGRGPFAAGPAAVVAVTSAAAAVAVGAAILLARARWSRHAAAAGAAAGLALGAASPLGWASAAGIALSALALAGAAGPWLSGWLRRLPSTEAPPPAAAAALAAAALLPAAVALIRHDGLTAADWVVVGAAAATAAAWTRAWGPGLWLARFGLPAAGLAAATTGYPRGLAVAAAAAAASLPSWHRDAALAMRPLLPRAESTPVPPELVDPALLAAAGYDDRGRALEPPR